MLNILIQFILALSLETSHCIQECSIESLILSICWSPIRSCPCLYKEPRIVCFQWSALDLKKSSKGNPNREKNSSIAALAVTSAFCDGNGIHSTHLVNWSTIIKQCSFPCSVLGRGPMYSMCTRSIGAPAWYSVNGTLQYRLFFLFCVHSEYDNTHDSTSLDKWTQKIFSLSFAFVLAIPWWAADGTSWY